jgi:cytidylate kinase
MVDESDLGSRVAVIGSTGSGKTMMARELAQRLGVTHVELDSLYWGPDWAAADVEIFRSRVRRGDEERRVGRRRELSVCEGHRMVARRYNRVVGLLAACNLLSARTADSPARAAA